MRRIVLAAVVGFVAARPRVAVAHQTSAKYVDIAIDGARATITLRVWPGDVTEPLQLPADARPSADDAARAPAVAPYVAGWLAVRSWGAACPPTAASARVDDDRKFVVVTWQVTCARAPDEADFTRFFAVDRRHVAIVSTALEPGDDAAQAIVAADAPTLALRERPSLAAWIRQGVHHILDWDGRDHISFVLALLLVVMLVRDPRDPRGWGLRPLAPTLRSTAAVITAFTIAHSVSLIAAALGWVELPRRFVESAIALSIAYTALEDIVRPDVRWRFALTFAFGLVHGLGFASTLAVQLPPRDVLVPLLLFNLGVELGQLTIVLCALPLLFVVARELGASRYRRVVMPIIAAAIFVLGLVWLVERALGVTVLGM